MELALEELARRYAGRAAMARVDAKLSPGLADRYGITCLPTILLLDRNRVVRRFLGTAMVWEIDDALRDLPAGDHAG